MTENNASIQIELKGAPSLRVVQSSGVQGVLAAAGQRAGADDGDPQIGLQVLDTLGHGNVGIWECQPGGWPVKNRIDTEMAYILAGTATITDETTGMRHRITAGDLLLLPVGWSGRWDVEQTVRKVYAIY
jgi:uncharacterized cupin superfamily protein